MSHAHIPIAYQDTPDKRLQATQTKLFAGLRAYFEDGADFGSVRVSALCTRAGVGRQTYYRHYESLGEIVKIEVVRMISQFLQKADEIIHTSATSIALTVDLFNANRKLLAMMRWSHTEEAAVQYLIYDMKRVNHITDDDALSAPFTLELLARMQISFAINMLDHPQLTRAELIAAYTKLMPVPAKIFHAL